MRRGVLKLTTAELEMVIKIVTDSSSESKALFLNKLNNAKSQSGAEHTVDVNEEDVETVMDALGIPAEGEEAATTSLRTKLQGVFLVQLG